MDDLVSEFLTETNDSLSDLDTQLVELEQNPEDKEIIDSIFRIMHTIKGTCGFLGLPRLASVAHASEDVLDNIRSDQLKINQEIISAILESIDCIKDIMEVMEEEGSEPEGDDGPLISKLKAIASGESAGGGDAPAAEAPAAAPEPEPAPAAEAEASGEAPAEDNSDLQAAIDAAPGPDAEATAPEAEGPGQDSEDLQAVFDAAPGPDDEAAAPEAEGPGQDSEDLQAVFDAAPGPDDEASAPAAAEESAPAEKEIPEETKKAAIDEGLKTAKEEPKEDAEAAKKPAATNQSIRVNLNLLENLMQMASELVLTRNQLLQINRKIADSSFGSSLQRLSNLTTELQESVMKTRMQPIGNAWAKFPRLVRDLSLDLNKNIELKMVGADTELDRQMLEVVKDPLTHMVRNAADHGMDTPEQRVAAGKDEKGTITLSSYHEGGHIIVKISDNGPGINLEKVKSKAIENGLATEAEFASMTDKQIYQFLLKPGFSTAEKVTSVSGRGVGMDVVVSNIEKIGGTLEVDSTPGKGSDFTIKLPLTLAIMSVLVVDNRGERFAIPQIRVSEIVHATTKERLEEKKKLKSVNDNEGEVEKATENEDAAKSDKVEDIPVVNEEEFVIETLQDVPVLRLRGKLLPLVNLAELLQLPDISEIPVIVEDPEPEEASNEPAIAADAETTTDVIEEQPAEENEEAAVTSEPESNASESVSISYEKNWDYVVICEVGSSRFGIVVDGVYDTEEIVVKPKSPLISDIEIYAGCTILGDGSVIMILDPNGIMKTMGSMPSVEDESGSSYEARGESRSEENAGFLLFKAGGKAPKAVPLELVSRLEEIDLSKIEWAGEQRVVQYRDKLMRILTADDSYEIPKEGIGEVIVFNDDDKIMGLLIQEVIDINETAVDIRSFAGEDGILGSMVFDDKTYDLIDVSYYFGSIFSDWLAAKPENRDKADGQSSNAGKRVLLVDDSPFFRKFMKPILVVSGYSVITAENGVKALEVLEADKNFDIIVTDIDMPEMTGIEFSNKCEEDPSVSSIPRVALTSYTSEDIKKVDENVKFDGYVSKSNRDQLVDTIDDVLNSLDTKTEEVKEA